MLCKMSGIGKNFPLNKISIKTSKRKLPSIAINILNVKCSFIANLMTKTPLINTPYRIRTFMKLWNWWRKYKNLPKAEKQKTKFEYSVGNFVWRNFWRCSKSTSRQNSRSLARIKRVTHNWFFLDFCDIAKVFLAMFACKIARTILWNGKAVSPEIYAGACVQLCYGTATRQSNWV